MGMHPHTLEYPNICVCIPIYWGTRISGDASAYTGSSSTWGCIPIFRGTPISGDVSTYAGPFQYMWMQPHVLGYTNIWGCIPEYWGTIALNAQVKLLNPECVPSEVVSNQTTDIIDGFQELRQQGRGRGGPRTDGLK